MLSLNTPVHFKYHITKISSQFHWLSDRFSIPRRNKHNKSNKFARMNTCKRNRWKCKAKV